ncbi:hypothetical protein EDC04DRAFT_2911463 [Pisolithus marmoratus]|nr:hypothetical protein EDC04DRAFT_2911463 [Pisolithus marmoratus]
MSEQKEQVQHHEIKAQREQKHLQLCQLAEVGSENDELEGIAGNDQSGIKDDDDNGDNGTQFSSHAVPMKLSGITKEHLMYSKNKVPKAPPATPDINRRIASSDNEDLEGPFLSLCPSSDCKSSQHKETKERHLGYTTPKVEDNPPARDMREVPPHWRDGVACTTKWHHESSKEDVLEPIVVKAQKVVEHEGHPCTRDYDDVTQEFVMTAISDYCVHLCAKGPMPNHAMETSLLDASWAQAHKVTSHGSQVCGQLKTKLCPLVKAMFSFHSSQSKNAIKKNWALAEGLKEGTNFAFKV